MTLCPSLIRLTANSLNSIVYACFGIFISWLPKVTLILGHPWQTKFRGKLTMEMPRNYGERGGLPYFLCFATNDWVNCYLMIGFSVNRMGVSGNKKASLGPLFFEIDC